MVESFERFAMPGYKCKNCGKVVSEPQLKSFTITYGDYLCCGQWCLCEECIKRVTKPKCAYFSTISAKNTIKFLSELLEIVERYKVNPHDVFFMEE